MEKKLKINALLIYTSAFYGNIENSLHIIRINVHIKKDLSQRGIVY